MKTEIFKTENGLAFTFRLRDLKTTEDKEAICQLINVLHNYHCVETNYDAKWLSGILAFWLSAWVGMEVMPNAQGKIIVRGFNPKNPDAPI